VVDRLTALEGGIYEIHDYKTSQTLPDQAAADADRQLALYQMAVESAFPDAREVRLVWHYLVFDKEVHSKRGPAELEQLRQETIGLIREIEAVSEFPPREGVLCDWCEYQPLCPLCKHLVEVEELPPAEFAADEGVRLADRYAELNAAKRAAEAEIKRLKEDIAAYCRQHGVEKLRGSDSLVSVKFSRTPAFPGTGEEERAVLEKALRAMGRWDEVSSLDTRKLGKVVGERKWPDGQLTLLDPYVRWEENVTITVSRLK